MYENLMEFELTEIKRAGNIWEKDRSVILTVGEENANQKYLGEKSTSADSDPNTLIDCFLLDNDQVLIITSKVTHLISEDWKLLKSDKHSDMKKIICMKPSFDKMFLINYTSFTGKNIYNI